MSSQRLSRAWKALHPDAGSAFDKDDELQADDLACHLLERYRSSGDAEAFALLFELTRPQLLRLAAQMLDRMHDGAPGDARNNARNNVRNNARVNLLVDALMRSMHAEGRSAPPRLSGFAVLAAGRMVWLMAGADRPGPEGSQTQPTGPLARSA